MADPVTPAAAGAAAAAGSAGAKWGSAKIKELAAKFRNREVAFIENPKIFQATKDARKNAEFARFRRFTSDGSKRVLLQLGIAMRGFQGNSAMVEREARRIIRRHGVSGLHLVEAMQAGLLSTIQDALEKTGMQEEILREEMGLVIENIDRYVAFIQGKDKPEREALVIASQIRSTYPRVFVVAGSGSAGTLAEKIATSVSEYLPDYENQEHTKGHQTVFVFLAAG